MKNKNDWMACGNRAFFLACGLATSALPCFAKDQPARTEKPKIEVCFVLDTTGSMSGLIEGAKQKIWSIANEIISAKPTPDIRIGLIGYRDRGDDYVTKRFDLTNDVDVVYGHLQSFQAGGGGDEPESVNEALDEAVRLMPWSTDRSVLKMIFLVGDSPPHMDYNNAPKYPEVCQAAAKKDLIVNTVQCGGNPSTTPIWQEIAKLSEGSYAAIAQSGNMAVITTPMDAKLAELNRKVGETLVAYGTETERRSIATKQHVSEVAPASVAADRLAFNTVSGVSVQGEGELLDSLNNGKLKFESIRKDQLPKELQKLNAAELKAALDKKQKERNEIQSQIRELNQQREDYLAQELKRLETSGKSDSFDEKVAAMIRSEAVKKGINYSK